MRAPCTTLRIVTMAMPAPIATTLRVQNSTTSAVIALGAGLAVVILRNAVHAALMLVLNFFAIAVLYAALEAQFLAVIQIIVYAGAIMVLFLFVLMLLGISSETRFSDRIPGQRTAAVLLGLALLSVLIGAGAGPYLGADAVCPVEGGTGNLCTGLAANTGSNVASVGRLLFTTYMWPFEVTSVLLVITAIGAMVLGKRGREEDVTDLPVVDDGAEALDEPDEPARGELVAAGSDGQHEEQQ